MYRLHGIADWGSQVIHMALAEAQLPYQLEWVDWRAGGLKAPGYLALNPFARVPTLETPGGPIFETAAILLHLAEQHTAFAPLSQDPDRAAFLTWFIFVTNGLHPAAMALLHPERAGGEAVQRAVADATHDLLKSQLAALDKVAAEGHWWLSGDRPSILSLYVAMLLRWIKAFPCYREHSIPSQDYPALHRMAKGIETRPLIQAAMQAEGLSGPLFSNPPCETVAG
jgi:glutathione S-transferase